MWLCFVGFVFFCEVVDVCIYVCIGGYSICEYMCMCGFVGYTCMCVLGRVYVTFGEREGFLVVACRVFIFFSFFRVFLSTFCIRVLLLGLSARIVRVVWIVVGRTVCLRVTLFMRVRRVTFCFTRVSFRENGYGGWGSRGEFG